MDYEYNPEDALIKQDEVDLGPIMYVDSEAAQQEALIEQEPVYVNGRVLIGGIDMDVYTDTLGNPLPESRKRAIERRALNRFLSWRPKWGDAEFIGPDVTIRTMRPDEVGLIVDNVDLR